LLIEEGEDKKEKKEEGKPQAPIHKLKGKEKRGRQRKKVDKAGSTQATR